MYLGDKKIDPLLLEPSDKTPDVILFNEAEARLTLQVTEETDRFIFKSIEPFCREVVKVAKIEKKKLEDIITKQMIVKPLQDIHCVSCGWSRGKRNAIFCEHCGQRLREDPDE